MKTNTKIFAITLIVSGVIFPAISSAALYNSTIFNRSYYPQVTPNRYYLAPHEPLVLTGSRFAPNDTVTISSAAIDTPTHQISTTTTSHGTFQINIPVINPFENQTRSILVTVRGSRSAYPVNFNVGFGSYYPVITPSTYYLNHNQAMSVSARDFAPGESVQLYINGVLIGQRIASPNGIVGFGFMSPRTGSNFNLRLRGQMSNTSDERTIYLAP